MSETLDILKQQAAAELEKEIYDIARNGTGAMPPPDDTGPLFVSLTLAELMQRPPKEWLIDNLIGVGDLVMIFGEAGSGKTFVTFDLMVCGAMGQQFAQQFKPARALTIAYCAGEGHGGLAGRATAVINKYGIAPDDLPLAFYENVPELFDQAAPGNVSKFITDLSHQPWDIVVIDTLHTAAYGADENSSKDTGIILQQAKRVRDALNCTVIIVHHANRSGNYRGSSALHGAMDTMLQTEADKDGRGKLKCFKQKDAEKFEPVYFRIIPDDCSESAFVRWGEEQSVTLADKMLTKMIESAGIKLPASGWGEALTISPEHANNILGKLAKKDEVKAALTDESKPGSKTNPKLYWYDYS